MASKYKQKGPTWLRLAASINSNYQHSLSHTISDIELLLRRPVNRRRNQWNDEVGVL